MKNFQTITEKLKAEPATIVGEFGTFTVTYADFIGQILGELFEPTAGDGVAQYSTLLWNATNAGGDASAAEQAAANATLARLIRDVRRTAPARDPLYNNDLDAFAGVTCTDGLHPRNASSWPARTREADRRAPYFGRSWGYNTAFCASDTWTVRDEDAYRGPFTRRTAAPVLLVGSYWDPATNHSAAVESAKLQPNSRLLSSTNFGHTSYGTSACATDAIDSYLLAGTLPTAGKICEGEIQPFSEPLTTDTNEPTTRQAKRADESKADLAAKDTPTHNEAKRLPPVAVRVPISTLNGTR